VFQFYGGGVEETSSAGARLTSWPTVLRDVLLLPGASSHKSQAASYLLDVEGRKVLELHSGANDISRLTPGVFFVREASKVTKVVIAK
jgi:hypothetical protein